MSRGIKILLIILGSLFALAVAGIVGVILLLPHYLKSITANGADPVAARRTAAKIATFDLPRGYRYETVSDFGLTQIVVIVPKHRRRNDFRIQLQGSIAASGNDASVQGMKIGMGIASKLISCDLKDDGTDDVMVRGVDVKLAVMQCTESSFPFRVESGVFPGNAAQATITAMGAGDDFDTNALHALLKSVR